MLSREKTKLIRTLKEKKYRTETGLFVVEGEKSVLELLSSDFSIDSLLITDYFKEKYRSILEEKSIPFEVLSPEEIKKLSSLQNNDTALAVVKQKENLPLAIKNGEIIIALDDIRDPGNLGAIIRLADWYGIKKIVASNESVDLWNSKTISASMGSFLRVQIFYTNLTAFFSEIKLPILGAFLEGENVHKFDFPSEGILLLGNESLGIKKELEKVVTKKITIPRFGEAESLNVATATAIILDNWKRKQE